MTEYIVSQEQFETIARAVLKNIDRPITEVVVGEDKLPKIVRCRDCKNWCASTVDEDGEGEPSWCKYWEHEWICEDGFCWWGEREGDE